MRLKSFAVGSLVLFLALLLGLEPGNPELSFWYLVSLTVYTTSEVFNLASFLIKGAVVHRCYSDMPILCWARSKYEAAQARLPSVASKPLPVIDAPSIPDWDQREKAVCKQMKEQFGGWGNKPFLIRGLMDGMGILEAEGGRTWTLDWLAEKVPQETLFVMDMEFMREYFNLIVQCTWKRFLATHTMSMQELVGLIKSTSPASPWYVNFAESLFGDVRPQANKEKQAEAEERAKYLRRMAGTERLWKLCSSQGDMSSPFSGYSGELFFGHSDEKTESAPAGTPVHSAFMRNLFLQFRGRRHWRLWNPGYAQLFRAQTAWAYNVGFGAHDKWDITSNRSAKALNVTYAPHVASIPSFEVEMQPGDLLYVPPWWWHDVRIVGGYSLGISARGDNVHGKDGLAEAPIVRFLKEWNSLDALVMDTIQVLPLFITRFGGQGLLAGLVETRQHGPSRDLLKEENNTDRDQADIDTNTYSRAK